MLSYHIIISKKELLRAPKIPLELFKKSKIILGIDPGTLLMGFGIIRVEGNMVSLVVMDVLKISARKDAYQRLEMIHHTVCDLVKTHAPNELAIEAPFFGKNVQSMLKLGRAQGVAIAAAMQAGVPVTEYSPRKIKQSITGNGNADKMQVMKMLQRIVSFDDDPKFLDATDALAVAVCHHFQGNVVLGNSEKKLSGWKDFLIKNPGRSGAR